MPTKKKNLIITPARNEESTISNVLKQSLKYGDVLVVNDASDDNTLYIAKKFPVKIISNATPQGYSNSKRLGINYAIRRNYENVILIDADGEHSPVLIKKFIENLKSPISIIFGRRQIKRFSEKIICRYYKIIYGVSDILCGMIAIKTSKIKSELLDSQEDDLGMEIILDNLRNKNKFTEINVFGKERLDNSRIYLNFYSKFKYLKIIFNSLIRDVLFIIKTWF